MYTQTTSSSNAYMLVYVRKVKKKNRRSTGEERRFGEGNFSTPCIIVAFVKGKKK